MTSEDQINMMLLELKRINSYLEKIDWKLWNLHEKYTDPARDEYIPPVFTPATVVKAQLTKETASVPVVKKSNFSFDIGTVEEVEKTIPTIPKYPSIKDL